MLTRVTGSMRKIVLAVLGLTLALPATASAATAKAPGSKGARFVAARGESTA